jgi:hypothetical protein
LGWFDLVSWNQKQTNKQKELKIKATISNPRLPWNLYPINITAFLNLVVFY